MLFTEPTFLFLFLPILLALYFASSGGRFLQGRHGEHASYGNWLLLIASVIFYAKGGGAFTWLMLGSIAFNYWMAIAVDGAQKPSRGRTARARLPPGRVRISSRWIVWSQAWISPG